MRDDSVLPSHEPTAGSSQRRPELPEELRGTPPRQAPDALYDGPLAHRRKAALYGCLTAGAMLVALARAPFVETMALYFLPLGYLTWIGLGIGVIGTLIYISAHDLRKARQYIEQGEVALARVLELVKTVTVVHNGVPSSYAFVARVELPREGREAYVADVKSKDFGPGKKDRISTRFHIGDLVPVVWLPGRLESTLQIYDFLEATPEHSLERSRGDSGPKAIAQLIGGVAFIIAFFFALFWNVYAFGRYHPLDFHYVRQGWPPFAVAAVVAIVGVAIAIWQMMKKRRQAEERAAHTIAAGEPVEIPHRWGLGTWAFMVLLMFPGVILLGGATLLTWCFTANALLDDSASKPVPVEITEMTQTTHNFVLRHYDMKYRRVNEEEDHSLLTTPEHLNQFALPLGVARVRNGWLGWPWVETVDPMLAIPE